jgi:hypothetical protein
MPSRRHLLSTLAGVSAVLAGCSNSPTNPPATGATGTATPVDTMPPRSPPPTVTTATDASAVHPPGTRVSLSDGSVTLRALRVRLGVVYPGHWMTRFAAPGGRQFLVADVDRSRDGTATTASSAETFSLRLDDESWTPSAPGGNYAPGYEQGSRVFFRLPRGVDADAGRVRWSVDGTTVRWQVPDAIRRKLATAPSFSLDRFAVRTPRLEGEGLGATAKVDVTLGVHNDGARDGVFVGLVDLPPSEHVQDYHPSRPVSFRVPTGTTITWRRTVSWNMPARGSSPVGLSSVAGGGSREIALPEREDGR